MERSEWWDRWTVKTDDESFSEDPPGPATEEAPEEQPPEEKGKGKERA